MVIVVECWESAAFVCDFPITTQSGIGYSDFQTSRNHWPPPQFVEPTGSASLGAASRALFVEKVRSSNAACQAGDFATAVALSAARLKQGQFAAALQDATRARELCPNWPKAYYRQGVALQCLGRHGEALAAFSSGLGVEPSSRQLLAALVEASLKSPLRTTLEPTFRQLEAMKLDQSPFVLISVSK
ncbi:unnamed protein product [Diatraea saccharalis]|uniref:Uncharacterized protein n=1 Tax=Diatraea saccharalis TaxID=40085 RepID=A0A9N9R6Y4_9NEOP|nr:unnamed protein product [Diatraea saccharalis]